MTKASELIKSILGEAINYTGTPIPEPYGMDTGANASLVPNPNDARQHGKGDAMDIEDSSILAKKIGNIVDGLDEDDITDELADLVEGFLSQVDPGGDLGVEQAALMLPLEDCQDLYEELTSYLDKNGIDANENPGSSYDTINTGTVPADLYPSGATLVHGGNGVAPATMKFG